MRADMSRKWLGIAVVLAALIIAGLIWKRHRSEQGTTTSAQGSAAGGGVKAHRAPPTPASISGRVTAAGGGAIAGAIVALVRSGGEIEGDHAPPSIETTDASGSWHVDGVEPGKYLVSATAHGFLPGTVTVTVAAAEQRRDVVLTLSPGGTSLRGTVTEVGGGPLAGVHVGAMPTRLTFGAEAAFVTLTGADGRYEPRCHAGRTASARSATTTRRRRARS